MYRLAFFLLLRPLYWLCNLFLLAEAIKVVCIVALQFG
jgi:hypothetical protein